MLKEFRVSTTVNEEEISREIEAKDGNRAIELMVDIVTYYLEDLGHHYVDAEDIAQCLKYKVEQVSK